MWPKIVKNIYIRCFYLKKKELMLKNLYFFNNYLDDFLINRTIH